MNIDELITNIKKKISSQIVIEKISIEDKSFLHKNHQVIRKANFI